MNLQSFPVRHNSIDHRFELGQEPDLAILSYVPEGGRVSIDHTYVPESLRGTGVGAALVKAGLEEARNRGWRVVPSCWFVAKFIQHNPEFADLVAD